MDRAPQHSTAIESKFRIGRSVCTLACLACALGELSRAQVGGESGLWIHGADIRADVKNQATSVLFVSVVNYQAKPGQEPVIGYTPVVMPAGAFQILIDNQNVGEVQVMGFEQSQINLDTVLTLDVSGSVAANFNFVRDGVFAFVDRRRAGKDQIAFVTFGSSVNPSSFTASGQASPFTGDTQQLKQFAGTPPSEEMKRSTRLARGVADAVSVAKRGRSSPGSARIQKVLFVFSDGHDEDTGFGIDTAISAAKANQVQIFSIGLPEALTRNAYHSNMRRIASETGGVFLPVNGLPSIKGVFERLDYLIKNENVLSFYLPRTLADGKEHTLEIQAKLGDEVFTKTFVIRSPFLPPPTRWEQIWEIIRFGVFVAVGGFAVVAITLVVLTIGRQRGRW